MSTLTFTYSLDPPASIDVSAVGQPKAGEHTFPIDPAPPSRSATASYYTAASVSLKEAQVKANEVFTAWKDAIGDTEKHKENTGKVVKGQGKAARMMAANKAAEAAFDAAGEDDESDEDGVDLQEAGACEFVMRGVVLIGRNGSRHAPTALTATAVDQARPRWNDGRCDIDRQTASPVHYQALLVHHRA